MENRGRRNWDNCRRSQNKRPPRGSWQPTVPSWEKEFCKVVGSMEWETLLQMKKFTHLYENVINWDDSAGQESFGNAKKRFWAEINGLDCESPPPDPDLYIDKINWDSEPTIGYYESDCEEKKLTTPTEDENHEPVIIFGDCFLRNQAYSVSGWGDDEENFKVPANSSPVDNNNAGGPAIGWQKGYSTSNNVQGWNYGNNYNNNNSSNAGRYVSSYRTSSRIQGNERYRNHVPRNNWGEQNKRRDSFKACGPVSHHHGVIAVGQTWNQ